MWLLRGPSSRPPDDAKVAYKSWLFVGLERPTCAFAALFCIARLPLRSFDKARPLGSYSSSEWLELSTKPPPPARK